MHSSNPWVGATLELTNGDKCSTTDEHDQKNQWMTNNSSDWDKAALYHHQRESIDSDQYSHLNETQRSWLLGPPDLNKKKSQYVDLGCIICKKKLVKWTFLSIFIAFCVIGLPVIIAKFLPKHKSSPVPPDNYSIALEKALLFFNAQKCKFINFILLFIECLNFQFFVDIYKF